MASTDDVNKSAPIIVPAIDSKLVITTGNTSSNLVFNYLVKDTELVLKYTATKSEDECIALLRNIEANLIAMKSANSALVAELAIVKQNNTDLAKQVKCAQVENKQLITKIASIRDQLQTTLIAAINTIDSVVPAD